MRDFIGFQHMNLEDTIQPITDIMIYITPKLIYIFNTTQLKLQQVFFK